MIARFRVFLPYSIFVPVDFNSEPVTQQFNGYTVRIYPPYACRTDYQTALNFAPNELFNALEPSNAPIQSQLLLINDGPTYEANAIHLDFLGESFNRTRQQAEEALDPEKRYSYGDPSPRLMHAFVNSVLIRVRSELKAPLIKPLSREGMLWSLEYLNDDGSKLERQDPLYRKRHDRTQELVATPLIPDIWQDALAIPVDYSPPIWETLFLDAQTVLPNLGASLVLMFSALETQVMECINANRAGTNLPDDFFEWLLHRNDYRKEASIAEKFDQVLKLVTERSLKSDNKLWETFKNAKNARNAFVHEGKLSWGGSELNSERWRKCMQEIGEVLRWMETLLPAEKRRRFSSRKFNYTYNNKLVNLNLLSGEAYLGIKYGS